MDDVLKSLEERVVNLGVSKLEKKIARLECRSWFLFLRVRMILNKIRFLKGEK
jgi:hypothetical protein